MNRKNLIDKIASTPLWDVIIIGGGATGLGAAVDSAARGFKTLLLEQADFAKSTSSRSTKLVHGGVRYLQQGDVGMVVEALRERGRMLRNCPHLVKDMRFIIGNYRWWEMPFYSIGLTMYDVLAGKRAHHDHLAFEPEFLDRVEQIKSVVSAEQELGNHEVGFLLFDQFIPAHAFRCRAHRFEIGGTVDESRQFAVPALIVLDNDNSIFPLHILPPNEKNFMPGKP